MSSNRGIIILIFIHALFSFGTAAQTTNINLGQISLEEGLSQSTVQAIVQDAQGFMWFGTQDGLNRYDGYSIKIYKHDQSDPNSVSDNSIWSLLADSNGNLWIGTEKGGLDKFVSAENKFYQYKSTDNNSKTISDNYVTSIFEDSYNNIWVGTNNGLNLLNKKQGTFTRFLYHPGNSNIKDTANLHTTPGNQGNVSITQTTEDTKGLSMGWHN